MNWTNKYFDELMRLSPAGNLLDLNLFPNAKELTESMGMYNAIRHAKLKLSGDYNCIVVGDGHTPRTGALVAMRTNYDCYSIDPLMRLKYKWQNINRLNIYDLKIQDMYLSMDIHTILMLPHAHVSIKTCLENIKAPSFTIISMDCCFDNSDIDTPPDLDYVDVDIISEKNRIKIWKNYKQI
jgi:hypothetical protein